MTYTPRPESVPGRVCAWFAANLDETMYTTDLALKFEVEPKQMHGLLKRAVDAGLLNTTPAGNETEWSAGPQLRPSTTAPSTAANSVFAVGQAAGKAARSRRWLPPIDVGAIAVEATPLPDPRHGKGQSLWLPLLQKLSKPGLASQPIAAAYRGSLHKASADFAKANRMRFALRAVAPDQFRIWRIE
jgi:hypothetical protein